MISWTSILLQLGSYSDFLQRVDEFPVPVHLEEDVTAADELAVDENLRNRRPLRILFDT